MEARAVEPKERELREIFSSLAYDEIELELLRRGYVRLEAKITRMTPNDRERYLIYLPSNNNDLWRVIRESGARIIVYIKVPWAVVMSKAQANGGGETKR